MNVQNTIPVIQQSSSDGTRQSLSNTNTFLKPYVDLVNRIATRSVEEKDSTSNFDDLTLSGVP